MDFVSLLIMNVCPTASAFSERYLGLPQSNKREYKVMYTNSIVEGQVK